jgi:hypothetical protein
MLRKFVCAVAVLALSLGFVMADEIKGKITKLDGSKLTIESKKIGVKELELAKDVKVFRMVEGNKEAVSDGLKAKQLTNINPKGLNATVITSNDNKVTEIILGGKKKKKGA